MQPLENKLEFIVIVTEYKLNKVKCQKSTSKCFVDVVQRSLFSTLICNETLRARQYGKFLIDSSQKWQTVYYICIIRASLSINRVILEFPGCWKLVAVLGWSTISVLFWGCLNLTRESQCCSYFARSSVLIRSEHVICNSRNVLLSNTSSITSK